MNNISNITQAIIVKKLVHFLLLPTSYIISISSVNASQELEALMDMSLADLSRASVTLTSVAKKEQSLNKVPAAVHVITAEQIRRSGARTIPEALSLVPGVHVARLSDNNWAVAIRGANEILFNKLLVSIDGRSIFNPITSGVIWENIQMMMADIDRIEVLLGPAGTMWGGNAVNGVVNIISKSADETQGLYAEGTIGDKGHEEVNVRLGSTINNQTDARLSVSGVRSGYAVGEEGTFRNYNVNMRVDHSTYGSELTVQLGGYNTDIHTETETVHFVSIDLPPNEYDEYSRGISGMLNYDTEIKTGVLTVNVWADSHTINYEYFKGSYRNWDADVYYRLPVLDASELTMGGGGRTTQTEVLPILGLQPSDYRKGTRTQLYKDQASKYDSYNVYSQLETAVTDQLTTYFGVKVEYFGLVDRYEVLPQARLSYDYSPRHQFWTGLGRAVVTPSIIDTASTMVDFSVEQITQNSYQEISSIVRGNENLKTEAVTTLDIGHRYFLSNAFSTSTTLFFSQYKNIRGVGLDTSMPTGEPQVELAPWESEPLTMYQYIDDIEAKTWGTEFAVFWQPTFNFKVNVNYAYHQVLTACNNSDVCIDPSMSELMEPQPNHIASAQTMWDVTDSLQFDMMYKYIQGKNTNNANMGWDTISTLDARLAWQKKQDWPRLELMVDGILNNQPYYESNRNTAYKIERQVYLKAVWMMQ
ncbi:TonB-dependent receptor plug domain-containing protein [Photobacterium sanguinicancri]|uniref:TonB-dependent receptor plug domain-containing protein n=1 Tax=Photobacterium sanguinicancri TaxID=875932 RepID=UPI00247FCCF9|nr:TonB-dependent receptor [Photobacterium sanguinicancri]